MSDRNVRRCSINKTASGSPVFHPIIRTHPETGRKALYFDKGKILRHEGFQSESDAIDELTERMIQPHAQ